MKLNARQVFGQLIALRPGRSVDPELDAVLIEDLNGYGDDITITEDVEITRVMPPDMLEEMQRRGRARWPL